MQAAKDLGKDNASQWAAAISFYALLSIFPLLLAIVSIAAFFVNPNAVVRFISSQLSGFFPFSIQRVSGIIQSIIQARGTASAISIVVFLWTGSRVFSTLTQALNIAFDSDETYGFLKRNLMDLEMIVTLGGLLVLAFLSRALTVFLVQALGLFPGLQATALNAIAWTISALLILAVLYLTYEYVPRRDVSKGMALLGALVATVLIMGGRPIFNYFVTNFGNYNLVYGSLAILIVSLVWVYLVALFVLVGGEIASHAQEVFIAGKSVEQVRAEHTLRAPGRLREKEKLFPGLLHSIEHRHLEQDEPRPVAVKDGKNA